MDSLELYAITHLESMEQLVNASWFIDDVTENEFIILNALSNSRSEEPEFSWMLNIVDDVAEDDYVRLAALFSSRFQEPQLWWMLKAADYSSAGDLGSYFDRLWYDLAERPDTVNEIITQPWATDGLDDSEAALLVVLERLSRSRWGNPELFDGLLHTPFNQSTTVTLPLTGDVSIWAFQRSPFPRDDKLLLTVANSVRVIEAFMGLPFPTTDIIIAVDGSFDNLGLYWGNQVWLKSLWQDRRWSEVVAHEMFHYYTHGPRWFSEGSAEFIQAYVNDRTGARALDDRRIEVLKEVQECIENGKENLRHLNYLEAAGGPLFGRCAYEMGENFLLAVFDLIGEEGMSSALRELYLSNREFSETSGSSGQYASEERIYSVFLNHTPPGLQEAYRDLYRRLHGGPYADPEATLADDHADEAAGASAIAIGETIEGSLDYTFDFDYFRFPAEEGQKYRIAVQHPTLPRTGAALYAPDDVTEQKRLRWKAVVDLPSGFEVLWIAPGSGEYYFAVQNFGGETGNYTVTVTAHVGSTDDHGDTLAAATALSIGGRAEGVLDDHFDYDYFWFPSELGRIYRVDVTHSGIWEESPRIELYYSDGRRASQEFRLYSGIESGQAYTLNPATYEKLYFSIDSDNGTVGSYTVVVRLAPSPDEA